MELTAQLNGLINKQISQELYNANLYNKIEHVLDSMGLENMSKFFRNQANEERNHANILITFLNDRVGGELDMIAIPHVNENISTIEAIATTYFEVEQETTSSIEDIISAAMMERDLLTFFSLDSFLKEQLEEEKTAQDFLSRVQDCLNNNTSVFLLDMYYK